MVRRPHRPADGAAFCAYPGRGHIRSRCVETWVTLTEMRTRRSTGYVFSHLGHYCDVLALPIESATNFPSASLSTSVTRATALPCELQTSTTSSPTASRRTRWRVDSTVSGTCRPGSPTVVPSRRIRTTRLASTLRSNPKNKRTNAPSGHHSRSAIVRSVTVPAAIRDRPGMHPPHPRSSRRATSGCCRIPPGLRRRSQAHPLERGSR